MKKIHQPHDKDFKFKYKRFGLQIHNWLFNKDYKTIEFKDTAEAETGKRKDMFYILNGTDAYHAEGQSTPITRHDTQRFYHYNLQARSDKSNNITRLKSYCICTAKPNKEFYEYTEDNNTFKLPVIYPKNIDGTKVSSTLKDKVEKQEELMDDDLAQLVFLADMDIDIPIKKLMSEKSHIITHANVSEDVEKDLLACHIQELKRFFEGDELSEMMTPLEKQSEDEKIKNILEIYGPGFDDIYRDGKAEGINIGWNNGWNEANIKTTKNLLANGIDEYIISNCTGISITELKKLKREL